MSTAILGATGFVGSNLARQMPFDELYNSRNIPGIRGKQFELVACAAAPGIKWLANKEPENDRRAIDSIIEHLRTVQAGHFLLISTVDVYPVPINVDEQTEIDIATVSPYGKHRLELEQAVLDLFSSVTILRLPGLFGPGLKKNIIFDFLNNNLVDRIHADSRFQFYCLNHMSADYEKARRAGIELLNVSTEPVSVEEVSREVFGRPFENRPEGAPALYDFRSLHAAAWEGKNGYLYDRESVLDEMRRFVAAERVHQ